MAVPLGLLYAFSPWLIISIIILGATTSTILIYIFGNRIKKHVLSKYGERYLGRSKAKMYSYQNKYGVIGLGLLLPGVFGPMLGMAIGIAIVTNTASSMLPKAWESHLWLAWPLLVVLVIISIWLLLVKNLIMQISCQQNLYREL